MKNSLSPIDLVESFILCFNENRLEDALDHLSEDVFYHNIPLEPIVGRDATRAFMKAADLGNSVKTEWETLAIAGKGDIVLTERIDAFYREDGQRDSIPVMGSFRIRNGKIAEWRDYFDLAAFRKMTVLG